MVPPFTFCDYNNVKEIHSILYDIADELKILFKIHETELTSQKKYIDRLWVLSQRYRILQHGAPGISLYPDFVTYRIKCEMGEEGRIIVGKIRESNNRITRYINNLFPSYIRLEKIAKQIDWQADSGMIQGDEIFKPLFHYVETVADLRRSFTKNASERQVIADILDYRFSITIEAYIDLIKRLALCRNCFSKMICFSELLYPKL